MEFREHYTDEKTGISYTLKGDYYYPDLELPEQTHYEIGKYGRMHLTYIKQYAKARYNELLVSGKLNSYLYDVGVSADECRRRLIAEIAKKQSVNEELKACDEMKWVGMMNNIRSSAEEIVLNDFIYV